MTTVPADARPAAAGTPHPPLRVTIALGAVTTAAPALVLPSSSPLSPARLAASPPPLPPPRTPGAAQPTPFTPNSILLNRRAAIFVPPPGSTSYRDVIGGGGGGQQPAGSRSSAYVPPLTTWDELLASCTRDGWSTGGRSGGGARRATAASWSSFSGGQMSAAATAAAMAAAKHIHHAETTALSGVKPATDGLADMNAAGKLHRRQTFAPGADARLSANFANALAHAHDRSHNYEYEHEMHENLLYATSKGRFPRQLLQESNLRKRAVKANPNIWLDSVAPSHHARELSVFERRDKVAETGDEFFGGQLLKKQSTSSEIAWKLLGRRLPSQQSESESAAETPQRGTTAAANRRVSVCEGESRTQSSMTTRSERQRRASMASAARSSGPASLAQSQSDIGQSTPALPTAVQQQPATPAPPVFQFLHERHSLQPAWRHFPSTDNLVELIAPSTDRIGSRLLAAAASSSSTKSAAGNVTAGTAPAAHALRLTAQQRRSVSGLLDASASGAATAGGNNPSRLARKASRKDSVNIPALMLRNNSRAAANKLLGLGDDKDFDTAVLMAQLSEEEHAHYNAVRMAETFHRTLTTMAAERVQLDLPPGPQ